MLVKIIMCNKYGAVYNWVLKYFVNYPNWGVSYIFVCCSFCWFFPGFYHFFHCPGKYTFCYGINPTLAHFKLMSQSTVVSHAKQKCLRRHLLKLKVIKVGLFRSIRTVLVKSCSWYHQWFIVNVEWFSLRVLFVVTVIVAQHCSDQTVENDMKPAHHVLASTRLSWLEELCVDNDCFDYVYEMWIICFCDVLLTGVCDSIKNPVSKESLYDTIERHRWMPKSKPTASAAVDSSSPADGDSQLMPPPAKIPKRWYKSTLELATC